MAQAHNSPTPSRHSSPAVSRPLPHSLPQPEQPRPAAEDIPQKVWEHSLCLPAGETRRVSLGLELSRLCSPPELSGRVTRWTYVDDGNVLSQTSPAGRTTDNVYDADGRLIYTVTANGAETTYDYDTSNRRTATTDPLGNTSLWNYNATTGNTTAFEYDAMRRKTAMIYPDGTKEQWTYDRFGRVVTYTTRAGQTKTTTYNLDGKRLTETWTPTGCAPGVTYTYDEASSAPTTATPSSPTSTTYSAGLKAYFILQWMPSSLSRAPHVSYAAPAEGS